MRIVTACCVAAVAGCSQILGLQDIVPGDQLTPDAPGIDPLGDAPAGCATTLPSFGAERDFGIGATLGSETMTVGDLDADGRPDVVVTHGPNVAFGNVLILRGIAGGMLGAAQDLGFRAAGVLVVDVDVDGRNDLVSWTASTVTVRIQDHVTPGAFQAPLDLVVAGANQVFGVLAGNFNGDSLPDLGIGSDANGMFNGTAYFGRAGAPGMFDRGPVVSGSGDFPLQIVDINGDGRDDLAFINGSAVKYYLQTPTAPGTFNAPLTIGANVMGQGAGFGQFNADTKIDLMIGTSGGGNLYLQTPQGFVQQPAPINGIPGMFMQVTDVNGDGRDDIVTPGQLVVQCAASGTFSSSVNLMSAQIPPQLIDISGDMKADLLWLQSGFVKVQIQN